MIVKIVDAGQECYDSDRYIQSITSESVASFGVAQKENIILRPDLPLLIGMTAILVISTGTCLWGVGYCLHKGWKIRKQNLNGYRHNYI